jgi:hypothetical protein
MEPVFDQYSHLHKIKPNKLAGIEFSGIVIYRYKNQKFELIKRHDYIGLSTIYQLKDYTIVLATHSGKLISLDEKNDKATISVEVGYAVWKLIEVSKRRFITATLYKT